MSAKKNNMVIKFRDQAIFMAFRPDERTRAKGRRPVIAYKKEYNSNRMFSYVSTTTKRKGYMTEVLCEIDDKIAVILSDQTVVLIYSRKRNI